MRDKQTPTKILFAEDLAEDVELAQQEIKKQNINFTCKVADTEEAFTNELHTFKPDVVISDYSMPAFDGMSALKIVRSLPQHLPFIMLTGSMNEETAVECMKAGADDYVIKEQIMRLPFAVREVIDKVNNYKEKQKIGDELRESEERYRSLIESANDAIISINSSGKIVGWNKAAEHIFGYTRNEITGREVETIMPENYNKEHYNQIRQVVEGAAPQIIGRTLELEALNKSGKTIPVELSLAQWKSAEEVFFTAIMRNISQRKETEKIGLFHYNVSKLSAKARNIKDYLKAIHQEVKKIMKADNFYIALYDAKTNKYTLPYFADEYEDLTTENPVSLDNTLTDYIRKTGEARLITDDMEAQHREKYGIELVGKPSPVWIGAPIINTVNNNVVGVIALQDYQNKDAYNEDDLDLLQLIATNIGLFIDRVNNLEKLRLLSRSVEQNPVSIVITNQEGITEYVNPAFTRITQYRFDEAVGQNPNMLQSGHHDKQFYQHLWNTILSGKDWYGEICNKKKDGTNYWVDAVITPIQDEQGTITHFVAVKEDITEKKKSYEDLKTAKERAEESDRLKTAFLANMSHEIRTPMNGILGFTDMLQEPDLSSEDKGQYISIIQESGKRMLNTVNDIIEMSKIETGIVSVETKQVDLNHHMEELIRFFKPEARKKGLGLTLDNALPDNDATIVTDENKLESVFTNLLKNAIKYTDAGNIHVGVSLDQGLVTLYIKDTGIGIPRHRQQAIFNRFEQADISDTRAFEGSGLGLSIAKSYVEMLGGKIWVESDPNDEAKEEGSVFYFSLPASKATPSNSTIDEPSRQHAETGLSGSEAKLTILIAEDDDSSYTYLTTLLRKTDSTILHAVNGTDAVRICRENPSIDLILMDIKMPEMDGYESTREIRKFNSTVPIIAQTAYALAGDREKALEAGCDDYIAKPLKKNDLMHKIVKLTGGL